jgi:predicted lipase
MTPMLIAILLGVAALALLAIWFCGYRKATAKYRAETEQQAQRAGQAETRVNRMQTRNASLQQLQQKQRAETIDDTTPQHLALRTDFDNDWSDRMPNAASGASLSGTADTASASGAAGD